MVIKSSTSPNRPNSEIEPARSRCALPHQATARISKFCAHMKSSSSPSIDSTEIDTENKALTSSDMTPTRDYVNEEFPVQRRRLPVCVQTMSERDLDRPRRSACKVHHR